MDGGLDVGSGSRFSGGCIFEVFLGQREGSSHQFGIRECTLAFKDVCRLNCCYFFNQVAGVFILHELIFGRTRSASFV